MLALLLGGGSVTALVCARMQRVQYRQHHRAYMCV